MTRSGQLRTEPNSKTRPRPPFPATTSISTVVKATRGSALAPATQVHHFPQRLVGLGHLFLHVGAPRHGAGAVRSHDPGQGAKIRQGPT